VFAHLDSRGKLNIGTSLPTAISSGGTGDITITLTDGFAIPVAGGDVTFTIVSGGGDIAASGKTDANGKLTVTYTAPSVTSATDIVISVAATASLADDGATIIMLSVIPPPLISPVVLLESSSSKIKSEESTTISINVTAAGKPLAGAYVTLVAEKGLTLNTTSGTTDSNGKMTVTATGNADVYNTRAKVTAIVYKPGYLQASSETTIQIDPKSDTASTPINVPGFETAMAIASIGLAFVLFTAMAMATRRRK